MVLYGASISQAKFATQIFLSRRKKSRIFLLLCLSGELYLLGLDSRIMQSFAYKPLGNRHFSIFP
jgi:hypothetical protein